jgi:formylglycine-generating enzyme required for sulfatase activity
MSARTIRKLYLRNHLMKIDPSVHPLIDGEPPDWASGWGHDRFGVFVDFTVTRVTQRMRWVPPGRFMMGSPPGERGKVDWEGPVHEVVFRTGFWLFETACPQTLWEAVMDTNPSQHRDPRLPVTDIAWDEANAFLREINARVPGLDLTLPSEAQWEYACRAGTKGPYYFNTEISRDLVNYESDGVVSVGSLPPNRWGFREMLGNVWEWCADHWHDTHEGAPEDGSAWLDADATGAGKRVMRGGSWWETASGVRTAYRIWSLSEVRADDLGFRCTAADRRTEAA